MNFSNIMGAAGAAISPQAPPTNQWSTTPFQCDQTVPKQHWALGIFCGPCLVAKAKATAEKTNPVFNFLCYTPVGAYNAVRMTHGILGSCGDDMLYGCLCMQCGARQAYTETTMLGAGPTTTNYGAATESWTISLFACEPNSCCKAFWCPCWIAHDIRSLLVPNTRDSKWFNYFCIWPMSMYGQTRHTAGIKSEWPHETCEDIFVGCFFYPCALVRANTEAVTWRAKQAGASAIAGAMGAAKAKAGAAVAGVNKLASGLGGKVGMK